MTIHDIQVIIAVYDEKSLTKAARKLNMTQPGVSKTLSNLESVFGEKLFIRNKKEIFATPFLNQHYSQCKRVIQEYEILDTSMRQNQGKSEISIACDKAIDNSIMPKIRIAFLSKYPNCRLSIHEVTANSVPELVESQKCSFGLIQTNKPIRGLRHERIGSDRVLCVCSNSYRIKSSRFPLSLKDLENEDMILTSSSTGIRASLDALLEENGIVINPIWTCIAGENALTFAEQGFGIAILSETFVSQSLKAGKIHIVPTELDIKRIFHLIWRDGLCNSEEELFLMDLCKKACAELQNEHQ